MITPMQTKYNIKHDGKFYALVILIIIVFSVLFSSCGTFDKLKNRKKEKTETKTETETVTSQTLTEQVDTSVVVKGFSLTAITDIDPILKGDTAVTETPEVIIKTNYDRKTNKIKTVVVFKDRLVPIKFNRTRFINSFSKVKEQISTLLKTYSVEKHRESGMNLFWYGFFTGIILIILLIVVYKFLKRTYFPFLP